MLFGIKRKAYLLSCHVGARSKVIVYATDCITIIASFTAAFILKHNFVINEYEIVRILSILPLILIIKSGIFLAFRLYNEIWRWVSIASCKKIVFANITSSFLLIIGSWLFERSMFSRDILIMDFFICLMGVGLTRMGYRMFIEQHAKGTREERKIQKRLIIIGAGTIGESLVREIKSQMNSPYDPIAFLDDDKNKKGRTLHGVPIAGRIDDARRVVREKRANIIIIAIASLVGERLKQVVSLCESLQKDCGVQYKIIPGNQAILDKKVSISQVREVNAEDLLRRLPVTIDTSRIHEHISGKNVLVTGGAGSIGSELVRQVLRHSPGRIIVLDKAESNLFFLQQELKRKYGDTRKIEYVIADACNYRKILGVFSCCRPDVVFHAAAYKHVPLMEHNPEEAIYNNVMSTHNVAHASEVTGVKNFVMISTDKAVKPTNVMGASKRIAEEVVHQFAKSSTTIFTTVRFGNVIGSDGSLIPLLLQQIKNGGPVTVTHKDIERYFMTIPEAVRLVLQAMVLGSGDDIFILDMGKPIKIRELAEDVIRLAGFEPYTQIEIVFTGLRPGEKMYEELWNEGEVPLATAHPSIRRARRSGNSITKEQIDELLQAARFDNRAELLRKLQAFIPDASLNRVPFDLSETNNGKRMPIDIINLSDIGFSKSVKAETMTPTSRYVPQV